MLHIAIENWTSLVVKQKKNLEAFKLTTLKLVEFIQAFNNLSVKLDSQPGH